MLVPRARRALLSLTTLGIPVLIALACTAAPPGGSDDDGPVNPDSNGDGVDDGLLMGKCKIDLDGDSRPDLVDVDGDGTVDGPGFDSNCDGTADGFGIDSNNDGIIDQIQNLDGTVVEPPATGGGGSTITVDGMTASGGTTGETEYCSEAEVEFVPQIPTVLVLVDRSSSMYELPAGSTPDSPTNYWNSLKTAILPVVESLQADVRFGFASFTGVAGTCTGMDTPTAFAVDNYPMIEATYNALQNPRGPNNSGPKAETPTPVAIEQATAALLADDSPGDRYILLVSDGEPDFCDDNSRDTCGPDALIASLQAAYAQGVKTLVFGIDNPAIIPEMFDYYAQAGMGELPDWTKGLDIGPYTGLVQSNCDLDTFPEWRRFRTVSGNAPAPESCNTAAGQNQPPEGNAACYQPAGDYSAEGGTSTAFLTTDITGLAEQINATVAGLKSCIFDLGDSGVSVKEGEEDTGEIFVQDELIPQDQWRMNSATVLELLGDACTQWQSPEVTKFFAGFPCEALIIVVK